MPDIFLSYSREDQSTARLFAEGLQRAGFSVWWDQSLQAGEAFDQVTEQALEEARAVIVLWSKASVNSRWVRAEATQASANSRLVPAMIEACKRPIMFELTHTAELSHWRGDSEDPAWRTFVAGLRNFTGRQEVPAATALSLVPAGARRTRARRVGWIAAGVAMLAVAAAAIWFAHSRRAGAPAATAAGDITIAVMPFEDISPNKDQGYLAAGVAQQILDTLNRVDGLTVIDSNSAFRVGDADAGRIREQLGADYIVRGAIVRDGDKLRIAPRLVDARNNRVLWSATYNKAYADILHIHEEIARNVADALQVKLGVGVAERPGMTRDVRAYEAYLESVAAGERTDVVAGVEALLRAVGRDENFAVAWATLAQAYSVLSGLEGDPSALDKAAAAFAKAQSLQADLPEVLSYQGLRSMQAGEWQQAARYVEAAGAAAARYGLPDSDSALLEPVGKIQQGLPLIERAQSRDPLNVQLKGRLARGYSAAGRHEAAMTTMQRAYEMADSPPEPSLRLTAMTVALGERDRPLLLRTLDDGIAVESKLPAASPRNYAVLKALLDKPPQVAAAQLRQIAGQQLGMRGLLVYSQWAAYFGDAPTALQLMGDMTRVSGIGRAQAADMIWSPVFRDMRKLPGFRDLVRKMGLVEYWRAYGSGDFCMPKDPDWSDFECH